nr:CP52k-like protein 11 isoform 1 [Chelonibia testudinaria]
MLCTVALITVLTATAASQKSYAPGFDRRLERVMADIRLPKLSRPYTSLNGLLEYLQQTHVPEFKFLSRIQLHGADISHIVHSNKGQYTGHRADLWQLSALFFYGVPKASRTVSFEAAFKRSFIEPVLRYAKYSVVEFLGRFSQALVTPTYPAHKLLAVLRRVGLLHFHNTANAVGGTVAYLELANVNYAAFLRRISTYRSIIVQLVHKHRHSARGYQTDLLQLAAMRYFAVPDSPPHIVSFPEAFEKALQVYEPTKYTVRYATQFLVRFNHTLTAPPYPGYKLTPILKKMGLPALKDVETSLGGVVVYLKAAKIRMATFINFIQAFSIGIKKIVSKYIKRYSGYQADLLQLAVMRHFIVYETDHYAVSFRVAFRQALKANPIRQYSVSYVRQFLVSFSRIHITQWYPGVGLEPHLKIIVPSGLDYAKITLMGLDSYLLVTQNKVGEVAQRLASWSLGPRVPGSRPGWSSADWTRMG